MKHFFSPAFLRPPWWLSVSQLGVLGMFITRLAQTLLALWAPLILLLALFGSPLGSPPEAHSQYIYRPTPYTYLFNTNSTAAEARAYLGVPAGSGGSFTNASILNSIITSSSIVGGTNIGSLITGATITGSLTGTNAVLTTPAITGGTNTSSIILTPTITGGTVASSLTGTNAVLTTPAITGGTNTSALFLSSTLSGFTSSLQTNTDLTASRVLVSDSAQRVTNSTVTATTLGYLDATSSVQTQLNGKGAATNGTYSGGTFTGATNAGLTVFGSASVTNSATSKLLVSSNLTALGSLRVGGAADTQTGNSLYGGDAIISGQIFGGGAAQNSGNALALNYEAGSALLPVIVFDNRTGTNTQMHMEFRLAGTRKGYVGYLGAASANARMMCINDDAGDGIQFQVGNNASGQGYRFYTGEGGGRYLMKLHPTAGGLAIGSSYWSTAPATNGVNIEGKVGLGVTTANSQLHVNGALTFSTLTKTGNYTITATDTSIIFADATGGAVTITLPAAASTTIGRQYQVFKVDSSGNAVNIAPAGSDTLLAGSTTNTTAQANCLRVTGYSSTAWIVNKTQ